jgi:endonuclease III
LRQAAEVALQLGGDVRAVLRWPLDKAHRALRKFPGIGAPGADKILLFTKTHPILALESNGLRVLLRLGYGTEDARYEVTYRSVQQAADDELVRECAWLIDAHQLLRRHGQEWCRRTRPRCDECALTALCPWVRM